MQPSATVSRPGAPFAGYTRDEIQGIAAGQSPENTRAPGCPGAREAQARSRRQRPFDQPVDPLLIPVHAARVDLPQHIDAVAQPPSRLLGRDTGVQKQRRASVPQIVGTAGQRRELLFGRQADPARLLPDPRQRGSGNHTTGRGGEQPAIGSRAELLQVCPQDGDSEDESATARS